VVLMCALPVPVLGQGAQPGEVPQEPAPAPATLPLARISSEAEAERARISELASSLEGRPELTRMGQALPPLEAEIRERSVALGELLQGRVSSNDLRSFTAYWTDLDGELEDMEERLSSRAEWLDGRLKAVKERSNLWRRSRIDARERSAPRAALTRIDETHTALEQMERRLRALRNDSLDMVSRISARRQDVRARLAAIDVVRRQNLGSLFERQRPPLWAVDLSQHSASGELRDTVRAYSYGTGAVLGYARRHRGLVFGHLLFAVVALWLIFRARGGLPHGARGRAIAHPLAAAVLLASLVGTFLHTNGPRELVLAQSAASLLAYLVVVPPMLSPVLRPLVYGLAAVVLVDVVRNALGVFEIAFRGLLLAESLAGVAALFWLRRPKRLSEIAPLAGHRRWLLLLDLWLRLVLVLFAVAFFAAVLGYTELGSLLVTGAVGSSYFGAQIAAAVWVVEELLEGLARTGDLDRLRSVRDRPQLVLGVWRRYGRLVAVVAWVLLTMSSFGVLELVSDVVGGVLAFSIGYGAVEFSVAELLAFGVTLWISWMLSRLVSFVLGQEVLSRLQLPRGVGFTLTTFTRYTILVIGFLIAMAVLGFSIDRLALVLSALGVGIGFGLQGVVSNFISGIIMLFERPVRVGDRVELEGLTGVVEGVGIRASRVRTFDGADVLVPNNDFITARVTNWTLHDTRRRITLPVGVTYSARPARVLEVLQEVVRDRDELLQYPEPQVLFRGFGDSALDFEIRVWTDSERGWPVVQSDLAVATYDALAAAGIEIPFPQRDLHLRSIDEGVREVFERDRS
jgi:small-conductance mechanosensitive channel